MDEQPDQQPNAQPARHDEAIAFSIQVGSDHPMTVQPQTPQQPANVPTPLTPPAQTPTPDHPAISSSPLPQQVTGNSQPITPQPPAVPRQLSSLGRPFPLSLSLFVFLGSFALLAVVFVARVFLSGGDWSDGATAVGIAALALSVAALLVVLLRAAAGRRSLRFALLSLLLLVALAGTGTAGLVSSDSLHLVQAQAMEKNGQWSTAVAEYGLAGQQGPNAADIARVQNAWGDQLLQQGDYPGALTHFQIVLDDYPQSGAEVQRALTGQFLTYATWLKNDPSHVPYLDAITTFTNYASNAGCVSECKATLAEVAPQAYYLYGVLLLTQKRYPLAISEFDKLAAKYGSSTYASQGHAKAATAYLAYGQQQISKQDCTGAVRSYKTLVANYKGTPEATTAQAALNAPQNVTGKIVNAPTNPLPTVHLSKRMNFNTFFFSDEYSTSIDSKTGTFTFRLVAQGTYFISLSHPVSGGIEYYAWPADSNNTYYSFTVTPLCPMQLGEFIV